MRSRLVQPTGTVTLVFTDVEESTALLRELGAEAYREVLGEHRRVVCAEFAARAGYEVVEEGDGFFYAFASAPAAVAAVREATTRLADGPMRIRIGVHTGTPLVDPPNYIGEDVHLAARIMSAGHGGQVLLSHTTRTLVDCDGRNLGEHRLKGFPEPVALFQLGDGRFPPLRTISNTNLPRPASSFVGREREVAEVVSLVRDQGARLVTLSGPGGTCKTRLAIEAAAELVGDFAAGVFWVGLAPVRDPRLVVETIAQTLGARRALAEHIGEREMLLLLDNVEQVVEAAPELTTLLRVCPNLRILVTTRELLRVDGEIAYAVPALDREEAVELFSARAGIQASETVAELCRELDNLPLAVELAAARIGVLSPEQILDRISQRLDLFRGGRDADARQQTLRATISWSFDLLSPTEQSLYARLSVFAGGFALEAAGEVCDATLDAIASLVDESLLRHTGERFWMLETIREFAAERLEESAEDEQTRRRHAWYFLGLFERHDEALRERRETFKE
jgi:predicted ATPase/class 3 adenylate cyclase